MAWSEIKRAICSHLGTEKFMPLDEIMHSKNRLNYVLITTDMTWVAPQKGYYYVTCVGKGGDTPGAFPSTATTINGCSGAGGGGVAISKLWLNKGTQIEVSCNEAISSFGEYLSATCGEDGASSTSTTGATVEGGAGGVAIGGNLVNANGGKGGKNYPKAVNSIGHGGGGGGAGGTDGADAIYASSPVNTGGIGYGGEIGNYGFATVARSGQGGGGYKPMNFSHILQAAGVERMSTAGSYGTNYNATSLPTQPTGIGIGKAQVGSGGAGGGFGGGAGGAAGAANNASGNFYGKVATGGAGCVYIEWMD